MAEAKMLIDCTRINRRKVLQAQSEEHHFLPSSAAMHVSRLSGVSQFQFHHRLNRIIPGVSKKEQPPNSNPIQITKKASKRPRGVLTISCPSSGGPGRWMSDYIVSLKELQLSDLAEDGRTDTQVYITLSLDKHAGFGMSVEGRVVTSIGRRCCCCSSSYSNEVDTDFNVWVLSSSHKKDEGDDPLGQLPELGGDPSVIYVRPGHEAYLDSLVQDTIRLHISTTETCSETCEKAQPKMHHIGVQKTASLDRRWSKLLELRKQLS